MRRVLILGAGFGGLELSTMLSEELGDAVEVTLIDKGDAFVFGYSKLDVMFGRTTLDAVRLPYTAFSKPGVRVLQETVTAIDPEGRRVTTDAAEHEADVLVVALGADYDLDATPGLAEAGNEFYSVAGAARLGELLPYLRGWERRDRRVRRAVQVPSCTERGRVAAARLPHGARPPRGERDHVRDPVPDPGATVPGDVGGAAGRLRRAGHRVRPRAPRDRARRCRATWSSSTTAASSPTTSSSGCRSTGRRTSSIASGMTEDGYVPVSPQTLETRFPGVYAVGDVATVGVPKAGVFSEGAAQVVASSLIASARGTAQPAPYGGRGSCYIELGAGRVGRVDVDFLTGPSPTGVFNAPTDALVADKQRFGSTRRARWFGLQEEPEAR